MEERYRREETAAERIDRNYAEQLQELRVVETGVQILFAFLLGIAFQQRFTQTDGFQRAVFVVTLLASALSIAILVAPVALHRFTFHAGRKDELVARTNTYAIAGLAALALSICGAVLLVCDWVVNRPFAVAVTAVLALVLGALWFAVPHRRGRAIGDQLDR
ncbi:MAG: DUF6328 family protein [Actinomycetota bacterium]|nr:DUF6328 family protein [Actinomycetota bacterium]